ncbi:hypothetical protein ACROYT_G038543 [Oculina patagonica]
MWCGVVWCGVVWCGVVWCGVVWCGVVWCGVVWCSVVWCGAVWCGAVRYSVARCGAVRRGAVWCRVVWCGVVLFGLVWSGHSIENCSKRNSQESFYEYWLCLKNYKLYRERGEVGNSDFNFGVHGQAAELSCGRELSSVVSTRNQSTKRSAIITVGPCQKPALTTFGVVIRSSHGVHLPLKQKRVKRKVQPKWFNTEILKGIKARDKLLNKARKSQTERDWNAFNRAKNTVTQLIRRTKQPYSKDKVTENKNNSRKLWNLIKCLSNDDKEAESVIKEIVENETIITDKRSIAEIPNWFFVDQPKNLVAALGLSSLTEPSTVTPARLGISASDLPNITQKRVVELLLSIPTHKATGDDGISAKILRIAAPAIAPSLTKLMNHCLSTQTFPNTWKIAKVTPVFKGNGSRNDKNNYFCAPHSLESAGETHNCEHLCNFLKEKDLFHPLQSGFRKSHSTETALIRLVDQLLFNLNNDKVTGLVFIDYKKAFDLIDHKLLLSKLKALGVGERSLPMFRDFLSGRR